MKFNINIEQGKLKVRPGIDEQHTIQVTISREVFAKIIMNCLTKRTPSYDIAECTEKMWQEFGKGPSEN